MGATLELSGFVADTSPEEIPADVYHLAKREFINFVGLSLYSSRDAKVDIFLDSIREEGGKGKASLIGANVRTDILNAALVNGFTGQLEEFDETHDPSMVHSSAVIFPAILGLAEDRHLSGKDVLAAFVLGYEVETRVAMAVHPRHYRDGWVQTGTCGTFGAAAAAGKLLGLDRQRMAYALGIAGCRASGLGETVGTTTKAAITGWGAQGGLLGALLASRGLDSTETILEGRRGFLNLIGAQADVTKVTENLGQTWELRNNRIKAYACGSVAQASVELMLSLHQERPVRPEDVASIQAFLAPICIQIGGNTPNPTRSFEAIVSIQHCLAVALLSGEAFPYQFTEAQINDPALKALRGRVSVSADPNLNWEDASVEVHLRDGSILKKSTAERDPSSPPAGSVTTDEQLERKFRHLAEHTLPQGQVEQLLSRLWKLDSLSDMSPLMRLLRIPRRRS